MQAYKRTQGGLLLFDKPAGPTSNFVLQKVKKIFNAVKAGHTGSLDPLATGLLVICFGATTRISDYLLAADKRYQVCIKLGVVTNTGDADGEVLVRRDATSITDDQVRRNIKSLTGSIKQTPPMFSAAKHQGTRLYKLARQGVEVQRRARAIEIYEIGWIRREGTLLHLRVHCSKGTYIRVLAEDLGKRLGCGAHVVALRRTGLGPFVDTRLHTLSELEKRASEGAASLDTTLVPIDSALQSWPAVVFTESYMRDIRRGHAVRLPTSPPSGKIRIYHANNEFYGIGTVLDDGRIAPKRLI